MEIIVINVFVTPENMGNEYIDNNNFHINPLHHTQTSLIQNGRYYKLV